MDQNSEKCQRNLEPEQLEIMKIIGQSADKVHSKCYVVGGLVRDCLTDKKSDDLDIVCTDIQDVASDLTSQSKIKGIGEITNDRFLTKVLYFPNDRKVDLVEPRKEHYVENSIKPIVEKGNLLDDAFRRDFTINTLRIGLNTENWLEIDDPTKKGLHDLKYNILDTPINPEQTFHEDPTRMLRAVRFMACKNMKINPKVQSSIIQQREEIHRIPKELIHKELIKGSQCNGYFRDMVNVGLLHEIFPEVSELHGIPQSKEHHTQDVLEHTLRYINHLPNDTKLRLVGLLHDIGKKTTTDFESGKFTAKGHEDVSAKESEKILTRLKFSTKEKDEIVNLVQNHMNLHTFVNNISEKKEKLKLLTKNQNLEDIEKYSKEIERNMRKFYYKNETILDDLILLSKADIMADNPHALKEIQKMESVIHDLKTIKNQIPENIFKLAISGHDLMNFGLKGKEIGNVKREIEEKVIDGILENNKLTLLQYLEKKYKKIIP